jgi:DMSO reductase family type II enzyme heme b subunit
MRARLRCLAVAAALALASTASAAGDAQHGLVLYQKYCSQCHGTEGKGDGPASQFVLPRPRVLTDALRFKFRTSAGGNLPLDEDIHRVIHDGIHGTSMPAFSVLSEQDHDDLVAAVKTFGEDFKDPAYLADAKKIPELENMKPLPSNLASLDRGRQVYQDNKCWQCHGQQGRGDGPSWSELKDPWGNQILPGDLTQPDRFRSGGTVEGIFRSVTTGVEPMPAYADSISVEDRWHLANYVRAFGPPADRPLDETVIAVKVAAIPAAGDDDGWRKIDDARDEELQASFDMFPNVVEPPRLYWASVTKVKAQAVYTDTEIALRVIWHDRSESKGSDTTTVYQDRDGAIHHGTDHPDQLAVQFPAKTSDRKQRPYFLFGDNKKAVNLWWWRGDTNAAQEMNAKGLGNLAAQPPESQALQAEHSWAEGRHVLLLRRTLTTADARNDVQFEPGDFVPMSFHAWDGFRGEVGNRGSLTNWRWLYLEPPVEQGKVMAKTLLAGLATLGVLGLVVVQTRRGARARG